MSRLGKGRTGALYSRLMSQPLRKTTHTTVPDTSNGSPQKTLDGELLQATRQFDNRTNRSRYMPVANRSPLQHSSMRARGPGLTLTPPGTTNVMPMMAAVTQRGASPRTLETAVARQTLAGRVREMDAASPTLSRSPRTLSA